MLRRCLLSLLATVAAALPAAARAQTDTTLHASNVWLVYNGTHALSSRWALLVDAQLRRTDFLSSPKQGELRPALRYQWTRQLSTAVGYAFFHTSTSTLLAQALPVNEHRVWEQLAFRQGTPRLSVEHRLRLEQRWEQRVQRVSGTPRITERAYQNRARYQFRLSHPLHAGPLSDPGPYATAGDELFFQRWGPTVRRAFDQNRGFAALGYRWNTRWRAEAGYMNQYREANVGSRHASEHVLQLTLFSEVPFHR